VGYVLSLAEIGQLSLPLAEHVAALHPAHAEAPALARLATAALAVGLGRRALAAAIEDVKGGSAPPRQKVQFTLSDMATEVDAASLAVWSAAFQRDAGRALDAEAAAAHLLATRTATRALHAALGLVTGPKRPPLELAYLDARRLEAAHGGEVEDEDLIASRVLEET
jgi:alkylation response protein AidB-like acyl-CoA dehydrogenase